MLGAIKIMKTGKQAQNNSLKIYRLKYSTLRFREWVPQLYYLHIELIGTTPCVTPPSLVNKTNKVLVNQVHPLTSLFPVLIKVSWARTAGRCSEVDVGLSSLWHYYTRFGSTFCGKITEAYQV